MLIKLKTKIYSLLEYIGISFLTPIMKRDWKSGRFSSISERTTECSHAITYLNSFVPDKVLDVGCGQSAWPAFLVDCGFNVTALDKVDEYWTKKQINRHYYVLRGDITTDVPLDSSSFDFITCISVIEHIPHPLQAVENMWKLLKPGGYLYLTFPYSEIEFVENIYKHPEAGYGQNYNFRCSVYSRKEISTWINSINAEVVDQKYFKAFTGRLWTMGSRVLPLEETDLNSPHQLTTLLLKKGEE